MRVAVDHRETDAYEVSCLHNIKLRQVQPQIEFKLVVVGLHVRAQLVEGLVVLGFLQVRQFVHHDHLKERRGRIAEDGGERILRLALSLPPCTREMAVCVPSACFIT
jgi:hypothetical protein